MKAIKILMPFGMIGSLFYFIHVFLGQFLWKEYNPITTDISSLTAVGAPNAELLGILTFIYGIFVVIFMIGMVFKSIKDYSKLTLIAYSILLFMSIASLIGFNLFPLSADKTVMNFQNMMHIISTVIVVLATIIGIFTLSFAYLKRENLKRLGLISLVCGVMIVIFGMLNPISIGLGLNILGLTERLVIFTLEIFIFFLSFIYTFDVKYFLKKSN